MPYGVGYPKGKKKAKPAKKKKVNKMQTVRSAAKKVKGRKAQLQKQLKKAMGK